MKTVKRKQLSNIKMASGNEKKYSKVILDGQVKEWMGIGWITLGKAEKCDQKKYPVVID
jgi:hypothetical protein